MLTKRFESLESVAKELASTRDVNSMLETITRRAGVAVRAPRYLLVAQLPGDVAPRIHHVGFADDEAEAAAHEVLHSDATTSDPSRLVVDIESTRGHFGRLAAFYPEHYHFLPQERSLLMAYAGHAAAALETAAALDESRDRNTTLSALLALGKALAERATRTEVAERLVDAMPGHRRARRGARAAVGSRRRPPRPSGLDVAGGCRRTTASRARPRCATAPWRTGCSRWRRRRW